MLPPDPVPLPIFFPPGSTSSFVHVPDRLLLSNYPCPGYASPEPTFYPSGAELLAASGPLHLLFPESELLFPEMHCPLGLDSNVSSSGGL